MIPSTASARSTGAGSSVPGTASTPTDRATRRAWSLSPRASITADGGPTKTSPASSHGARERGSLGQEPVARVDRLRPRRQCRLHDRVDPQVALGGRRGPEPDGRVGQPDVPSVGVRIAVDRDRSHPEFVAGADDPDRDLAPVGHQDPLEWRPLAAHPASPVFAQRRPMPTLGQRGMLPCFFRGFVSRLSASNVRARMSLGRVSDGRMTSSTYPRAAAMYGLAKSAR